MRYIILKRVPSGRVFKRKADPNRPYVWMWIFEDRDKELCEDMLYKLTDGDKRQMRNYKIEEVGGNEKCKR